MNKKPIPRSRTSRFLAAGAMAASSLITTLLPAAEPEPVLHFDGIESIIQTELSPEDLGIDGANPKTIEAWVKAEAFGQHGVFHIGTSVDRGEFALRTNGLNDNWLIQVWANDIPFTALGSSNTWTHFAVTYDGTHLMAYVNGEPAIDPEEVELVTQGDEWDFRIGSWRDQNFDGAIRDVRIWNVARTEAEIQATMDPANLTPQPNLLAWWLLDEGSGRTATDSSGNGHDAPIYAAQWESQQFDYDPTITADFTLDFGTGPGQVDASGLLRNRADHFSVVEDGLQMTTISGNFISTSATASVSNYEAGNDFVLESEVVLNAFPDARPSRLGFVMLGGPHEPLVEPFDTNAEEDFYAVSYFPALSPANLDSMFPAIESTDGSTGVIAISHGFNGPFLAAQRWDGRGPGDVSVFADTFEDPATDDDWLIGTDSTDPDRDQVESYWEFGAPTDSDLADLREGSTRVAGTKLDDGVPPLADDWLRTPVIDLAGVASASLSFYESLFLSPGPDQENPLQFVTVSVVNPDGTLIAELGSYFDDSGNTGDDWRLRGFQIPEEAYGKEVRIEFRLVSDDFGFSDTGAPLDGWMIDDVSINTFGAGAGGYALKAEGTHGFGGELELTVTLTDLADAGLYSQSLSTTIADPIDGNLFGVGGRMQASDSGEPVVEFKDFSFTQLEPGPLVGTTQNAAFYYAFGTTGTRVGTENFSVAAEEDWTLQAESLQLGTDQPSGVSTAVTRVSQFVPGNAIHVESDVVLTSLGTGGTIGLVLFGEEDPTVFDTADSSTYYTLQYIPAESKVAIREGISGTILDEAAFPAPVEGTSYRFEFTGNFDASGDLDYTATVSDGADGLGTLTGTLPAPFEGRNLFGLIAAQGGGDTWDIQNFGGYTSQPLDPNYRFYRWTVQGTKGSGSYQLAEFSFFYEGVDLLAARRDADEEDVPTVTGPNMGSANENPSMLVDGNWMDGDHTKLFGGGGWADNPVVFDLGESTRIDGYMLWTANDFESRDPTAWTLEGSHDGLNWDLIDSRSGVSAPSERYTRYLETGEFMLPTGAVLRDFAIGGVSDGAYVTLNGVPVTFSWDTSFATSVSIQPGIGQVGASGSIDIVVPEDAQTTYTLTAVGADGVEHTATASVYSTTAQTHTYRYVRFDVPSADDLRGNGNSIQIAGFEFFLGDEEKVPVSVTNPGGDMPDNEPAINLLDDNSGSKWLDFNKATRGSRLENRMRGSYLVFDFGAPTAIDSYRFITGNDAPERDPVRWRLWGRDSEDAAWTLIENVPFDYAITTVRETPTPIFPLPTDLTPSAGVIDVWGINGAGADTVPAGHGISVEDGTTVDLFWETAGATGVTVAPAPGEGGAIDSATVLPPQSASTLFTLTVPAAGGSTVEEAWVRSVPADHFESVRYVRFDIPDASALRDPETDYVQMSEFDFFRNGVNVEPVSVENPNGDINFDNEAVSNLLDNDTGTKWADANLLHIEDSHLVFDFGEVVEIDAYQFTTGNDLPHRDPMRWRMYGRNTEEEEWRLIEDINFAYSVPWERLTAMAPIPLPGPVLEAPTALPLSDWLDLHFTGDDRTNPEISGLLADPAGDGVSNLLKYAFGLDPFVPVASSSEDLPQAEIVNDTLRLTYIERIGAADITYTPQKSFTLTEWNTDGIVEVGSVAIDGEFERVTVELPLNAESRAFLRVQVTGGE